MKWRVTLELVGPDGIVGVHEVGDRAAVAEFPPRLTGLTPEEGKHLLAASQVHLVQAQAEDHCGCRQLCGALRPFKDQLSRRLVSLFGTVEVCAPRFTSCRRAVTCRRTLNPVAEIMPDRCTPEHERTVAKMGSRLPFRRARTLRAEFLPLGRPQAVETTRKRNLRVGTRLEQEAVSASGSKLTSVYVQVPDVGLRMTAPLFARELEQSTSMRKEMLHYAHAFFSQVEQSAACNQFRFLRQRRCRWFLMTHDRMQSDEFLLTQAFLAMMPGMQRTGVTAAASALQQAGLIRYPRGNVTIIDRAGLEQHACECYGISKREVDRLLRVRSIRGARLGIVWAAGNMGPSLAASVHCQYIRGAADSADGNGTIPV